MTLMKNFQKLQRPSIPKWQKRAAMQSSLKASYEKQTSRFITLVSISPQIFRQAHSDKLAQYEEALQILKQHSPDGKFPTMKDLRAEREHLTIQKDAQYDTYHYFKDYYKELQTVCANVDSILGTEQEVQQHEQQRTRKYEQSL